MSGHSTDFSIPLRHDALPELFERLDAACLALGIATEQGQRLQLAAEELFINTVDHGFSGKSGPDVHLALALTSDGLRLRYEDRGKPFDPSRPEAVPEADDSPGGLGLALLQGLSRHIRYRHEAGRNITELWF